MNTTDIKMTTSYPECLKGLLREYQANLDWLNTQRTNQVITPNDMDRINSIRTHLMHSILDEVEWKKHFGVMNPDYYSHPEKCELFLFDNCKKCIRKYDGWWYILDVTDMCVPDVVTTKTPEEQAENSPLECANDPVTLMMHVLIKKVQ